MVEKWWGGIYKSSTFRNSKFGFLALFVIHVSLKENGSLLCVYLCMNLRLEYFTKSLCPILMGQRREWIARNLRLDRTNPPDSYVSERTKLTTRCLRKNTL